MLEKEKKIKAAAGMKHLMAMVQTQGPLLNKKKLPIVYFFSDDFGVKEPRHSEKFCQFRQKTVYLIISFVARVERERMSPKL